MPIKRLTVVAALVSALLVAGPLQAKTAHKVEHAKATHTKTSHAKAAHSKVVHAKASHAKTVHAASNAAVSHAFMPVVVAPQLNPPVFNLALAPTLGAAPSFGMLSTNGNTKAATDVVVADSSAKSVGDSEQPPATAGIENVTDLRKSLIAMAMNLRDTRYVRGGRDPSTGFDCSGFVRYVFAHATGIQLPTNSASQFLAGLKVKRADMKPGDLVFFHTGRKQRISHVGIYISNGQFIHSPATGKSVEVSSLDESYWARHFAGAKRPQAIASVAHNG